MGSFFAGIKAGTLSGILYIGGLAVSIIAVLYLFQTDAVVSLTQSFAQFCVSTAPVNSTTIGSGQDCFDQVVQNVIPAGATLGFFVALGYAGVLGLYYEVMPGKSPLVKGLPVALGTGLTILVFGLQPLISVFSFGPLLYGLVFVWTAFFGVLLGKLYRRYTKVVGFQSQDPKLLKVMIDGRNFTGKSMTFATTSSHSVRAELAEDASFKEWEPNGGISIEDPRSFETVMEVNGDGTLRAKVGEKY